MIKEIRYTGVTATPSDYISPDGELDAAINLVPENGELVVEQGGEVVVGLQGYNVIKVFIHKNTWLHYLVVHEVEGNKQELAYLNRDKLEKIYEFANEEHFDSYTCIGNTIIITTDKHFYYFLWRETSYVFLGNSIPQPKIAFALDGEVVSHTYDASEVVFETPEAGTGDTQETEWQGLYGENLVFENVPSVTSTGWAYSNWIELEWRLDANVEYKIHNGTQSHKQFRQCIQGWNGTEWCFILGHYKDPKGGAASLKTSNESTYIKAFSQNFTKLRVCILNNLYEGIERATLSLHIDKGVTKSATISKTIKRTKENLDAILAKIQLFNKTYVDKHERFIYPFFVRYAVRMYDQTAGYISTPILMVPNTGCVPMLNYHGFTDTSAHNSTINAYAFVADLYFDILENIPDGWEDVIDGVDIYISAPIYPYKQDPDFDDSEKVLFDYKMLQLNTSNEIVMNQIELLNFGSLRLSSGTYIDESYKEKNLYEVIRKAFDFGSGNVTRQWMVVQVSPKSNEEIMTDVQSVKNYYHIKSFDLSEVVRFARGMNKLEIKDDTLNSGALVTRMQLDENSLLYKTPKTGKLYSYNNRLHAYGLSYALPVPTAIELQNGIHFQSENYEAINDLYVYLKTTEGEKVVHCKCGAEKSKIGIGSMPWFYYPDSRAYKATWWRYKNGEDSYIEIELKKHDYLPGAYWVYSSLYTGNEPSGIGLFDVWNIGSPPKTNDVVVSEKNVIYVSAASNPFVFDDSLTFGVGCNEIYALSVACKALSQGQFGQFPLYAFGDNGVIALELTNEGKYVSKQPITRDVVTSTRDIAQIDNAVLFNTDRGIMLLSGSESICISDAIDSPAAFTTDILPKLGNLPHGAVGAASDMVPFREFLKQSRMLYDYNNQRIIVYNPEQIYAYVYSLKSKQWGMMENNIKYGINSYPECLAVDDENNIVNMSKVELEDGTKDCLIISRPLKLDDGDLLKTIDTIITRGKFRKGAVKTILYGSRDLFSWHLVASSVDHYLRGFRGTPYKYFRIVLACDLQKDESIFGSTIQYTPRLVDKIR